MSTTRLNQCLLTYIPSIPPPTLLSFRLTPTSRLLHHPQKIHLTHPLLFSPLHRSFPPPFIQMCKTYNFATTAHLTSKILTPFIQRVNFTDPTKWFHSIPPFLVLLLSPRKNILR